MCLSHPVGVEVLRVVSNPWFDDFRFPDIWVRVNHHSKCNMANQSKWQHVHNHPAQMPSELRCLFVVVEYEYLVYPILYNKNEKVQKV
jgi:hypothetical protein